MGKVSQEVLLQRAESKFLEGDYKNALQSYALILKEYPMLDEAKVGVYLSDLGTENEEEAQALFDYYQAIKDQNGNAVEIIDSIMNTLTTSRQKIEELLGSPDTFAEQVEYAEGIRYSDFVDLIESKGSFKRAFEDIMFSTKVIITNKDEFIDFVTKLTEEGFDEMALNYLDATASLFGDDQDVLALYHIVKGAAQ
jgi:tetratricopeptide (TPR) repeat protein